MRIEYESNIRGEYGKIIDTLPEEEASLIRLLRILDQTLFDALEQAEDFDCEAQSDYDVPSIAWHKQNRFRYGFCPIIRVMAEIWERIALATPARAIELSMRWIQSPFVLFRRLAIFAMTNSVHPASDFAKTIIHLRDSDFWVSGARVEIMRGLVERWDEFSLEERENIEKRICDGPSIELYDIEEDADADRSWPLVRYSNIYRRLKRLGEAGRRLDTESLALLERISNLYPEWRPSPADQDDFRVWHYDIDDDQITAPRMLEDLLLEDMPDSKLIEEALKSQREIPVDQFGLWNAYCLSDPERAFRLLKEEEAGNKWNLYAWRALFSATRESQNGTLLVNIADAICEFPESILGELADAIAIWVEENQDTFAAVHRNNDSILWLLWIRISKLVYSDTTVAGIRTAEPVSLDSIRSAADSLARTLVKQLVATKPERGVGLGDLESYFDLIVRSESEFGIRGRKLFASELGIIHWISPDWAGKEMLPRFQIEHRDSLDLWKSFALGRTGSAKLFKKLKMPMLDMIPRPELSDRETDSLVGRLVWALIQCRLELIEDCDLNSKDVRNLLATGPLRLLERFAWQLRDRQSNGLPASWSSVEHLNDKSLRWKELVGPIFEEIWPLNARLRSERASRELVQMVMDTEDAFPEAVDKVIDYLKPYRLNSLEFDMLLGTVHAEMVELYPREMLILADALIDPQYHPLPSDLGKFLDDCWEADSGIYDEPAYHRLDGFRRLGHS